MSAHAGFIAGDWGGSHLRLYLCGAEGVLAEVRGPGIAGLRGDHAAVLAEATAPWRDAHGPLPLLLAGMVGARNGWVEVPYAGCPAGVDELRAQLHRFESAGVPVAIVPGLACTNALGAPDVMRGEETQVLGALLLEPGLARGRHVLALPGTHCKWVEVEDGRIVRFNTAFTGELFHLLRTHSLLAGDAEAPHDATAFAFGLERADAAAKAAVTLPYVLFEARSRQLREGMAPAAADSFLSGLLVGSDVLAAPGRAAAGEVVLIGAPALAGLYAQALARQGRASRSLDGARCVLAGLRALAGSAEHG